ncbi:MAG: sigma 54-interacting transcriptional regulator [Bacteroidetes bacterium]|uniref:Sigma 54-interacting transcriptional regulator n=1 Tax=Candidatus Caccoplasma merdipullorum TaxID=2840718 RepID=A0A9D9E482_9BACT|nr:sigma 54-interacting transcriptional regulator [Candidatus Caccoplasma merdipullorum]
MTDTDILNIKQRFGIIGNTPALSRAITRAMQIAPFDISVLITGESGTGKEFFPQIIHANSLRKHNKYIAVNCGAIPEGTIDSELFGHEKGAFTGALADRKGYFEEGNGGTIFLDEVGELPMTTQARLLRVLENGEFIKVGSSKVQKTDVRIVAATNLDMEKAVAEGKFREDLFYRLNTVRIELPPLRERKEDILLLFRKFSTDFAEKYRMPAIQLAEDAKQVFMSYRWPGNIRQLRNITEQISIFETSREVTADILRSYLPLMDEQNLPVPNRDNIMLQSEKEMLYKIILDMRKELDELKSSIQEPGHKEHISKIIEPEIRNTALTAVVHKPSEQFDNIETVHAESIESNAVSLEEAEKDMIRKALERNNGKRKKCAEELKISERTLYRKIKEYNLE